MEKSSRLDGPRQALRYVLAVIAAPVIAAIASVIFAISLDLATGHSDTGGRWSFNLDNVIVSIQSGLVTGVTAGWIARRRGLLIGAIANFAPLLLIIGMETALNRHILDANLDTKPALWVWISLPFAMLAGRLAARSAPAKIESAPT